MIHKTRAKGIHYSMYSVLIKLIILRVDGNKTTYSKNIKESKETNTLELGW